MKSTVRTIYGSYLQTCLVTGKTPIIPEYSTLNEKFNINTDRIVQPDDVFKLRYISIGNGGHRLLTTGSGVPIIDPVQHRSRDASLYNPIPFIVRPLYDDLSDTERNKYRLRVITTINGETYAVYYLKVLDFTNIEPSMEYIEIDNQIKLSQPFTPVIEDLTPTPPALTNTGVNTVTNEYLASSIKIPIVLSSDDILEIINACEILYSDPSLAIISEIGFCTGVDRPYVGQFSQGNQSYIEATMTQLHSIINVFYALSFISDEIQFVADFGSLEPLLALS